MTNQNHIKENFFGSKVEAEIQKSSSTEVFFNACFDKNHLKTLIAWFLEQYGEKVTVDLVETLKQVGFHQATRAGVSLGVDDLKIPPQKNTLLSQAALKMDQVNNAIQTGNLTNVEKSQRLIDTWNQTSETLRQTAVSNFRTTNPVNPVYMMAFSGARGNISQVRQLVAMRGLMADPQGAILEFPIQSNFREGLTVTEYLISCYGARKGLVDTALRTATSGYLTRRLVDAVQHVVVLINDCQTKNGIVIKEKNIEQRLIGRVLFEDLTLKTTIVKKNTLISPRLAKQIASNYKEIIVRSPLTCKTEKSVCQLCYGLDLSQGKLVSIGEAVGIIAAQSIGEPGTQLTMRTFHTGGVGVFSDQAMKPFTAPFDGKVEFLEPLSGLFVRTPHGNIVYLLKQKTNQNPKPLLKLTSVYPSYKPNVYHIMDSDVPSGSLLWVKQGEVVKSGQLLLQASRLQTTTQEMPESSHPVRAPLSGEIFFQSMAIRVVEEEKRLVTKSKKKKQQSTTSSQTNQKEISPKFPTLIELGNFWIFSSFIQKEKKISNAFFIKGDLVSSDTPVQQYNLHLLHAGQLKKFKSSLVFGQNSVEFPFSSIQYSGLFYFLYQSPPSHFYSKIVRTSGSSSNLTFSKNKRKEIGCKIEKFGKIKKFDLNFKKQQTPPNLLVYTSNSKSSIFTWYPFFKNALAPSLGYCLSLPLQIEFLGIRNTEIFQSSKTLSNQKQTFNNPQDFYYIWSPHSVFDLKTNSKNNPLFQNQFLVQNNKNSFSFCVISSQNFQSFLKTGLFQIDLNKKVTWNLKTRFEIDFRKNLNQKTTTKIRLGKKQTTSPRFQNFLFQHYKVGESTLNITTSTKLHVTDQSKFLKTGLKVLKKNLFAKDYGKVIKKHQNWAYIPQTSLCKTFSSQLSGITLEPSKKFENLRFENSYVSTNLIHKKNIFFIKSKTKETFSFYSLSDLLEPKKTFQISVKTNDQEFTKKSSIRDRKFSYSKLINIRCFNRKNHIKFCFYKQHGSFEFKNARFNLRKHRRLFNILFFQKNFHQIFSTLHLISKPPSFWERKQNIFLTKKDFEKSFIQSPLFNKQCKTIGITNKFFVKSNLKPNIRINYPKSPGWFSFSSVFKIELTLKTRNCFNKKEEFKRILALSTQEHFDQKFTQSFTQKAGRNKEKLLFKRSTNLISPGFTLFFYQGVNFQNSDQFSFFSFKNGWILPEWKITEAFLTSKKLGEFTGAQEKQKQTTFSILQTQHRTSFKLPNFESKRTRDLSNLKNKDSSISVGKKLRWGQQLVRGFAISLSGQIIKTTKQTIVLRKGIPLLASIRGLVHISHKDLIQKNDLLITLRSRRLQTEDIVQGIPKIEQLFEARETQGGEIIQNNMHTLLNNFFNRARKIRPFTEAVELSVTYIQKFLVENILEAYSNQGVSIAEKHVEVVVRQMTARVRITNGGDTGFLPGEFVQLRWIEKVNLKLAKLGQRQAQYEPIILGITKSVLQSESFLVAASFQQVSKVLVKSALAKKTDFLRGLHENILVGQPIPAGTGIVELTESLEKLQDSLESST